MNVCDYRLWFYAFHSPRLKKNHFSANVAILQDQWDFSLQFFYYHWGQQRIGSLAHPCLRSKCCENAPGGDIGKKTLNCIFFFHCGHHTISRLWSWPLWNTCSVIVPGDDCCSGTVPSTWHIVLSNLEYILLNAIVTHDKIAAPCAFLFWETTVARTSRVVVSDLA